MSEKIPKKSCMKFGLVSHIMTPIRSDQGHICCYLEILALGSRNCCRQNSENFMGRHECFLDLQMVRIDSVPFNGYCDVLNVLYETCICTCEKLFVYPFDL